ncbi:hypothetical protein [Patiriisocius marinus]|uniref:Uncharacterized protein n=1 Tax=Patiriisocius marinus TaxID=1397112 RepID=A0A5J4J098_9FLAO|nr:hypothetical protein [Patiriisocius marinus]GER59173.1 hypothetical protein ULMA_12810 [Patiriisocius marinus]
MDWVKFLEKIWVATQLTLYTAYGLIPVIGGIYAIYYSQTEYFRKDYLATMYLSMGIVSLLIGILVAWACFVKAVEIYREYQNSKSD